MFAGVFRLILTGALSVVSVAAAAQAIPPSAQPGRERDQLTVPSAPLARPAGPQVVLPSTAAPEGAATIRLRLRRVTIVGATVYSQAELAVLYRDLLGHEVSLQQIYDLAKAITAKYGKDGYVLSRAVVPPQQFARAGAEVRIRVVEGYIDRVVWPDAVRKYQDFFSDYTAKILLSRPTNIRVVERYLLLAGDLPGLTFASRLRPSREHPAASVLVVEVKEKPIDAAARIDNRGSEARGPYQYLLSATVNNAFKRHEAFTFTYAGTFQQKELQYFAGGFRKVLNSEGLTAFTNLSYGAGRPGLDVLQLLDFRTRSLIFEGGLTYPVVRLRDRNLFLTALMFTSDSKGDMLGADYSDDRLRGIRLRGEADLADSMGGINRISATFSQGFDGFGSTSNGNPLASVAGGRVDFSKIDGTASRLQPLGAGFSLLLALEGQYGFTTLLAPEQCSYGGRVMGRAYDPSELTGDHCLNAGAELRYDVAMKAITDRAGWLKSLSQTQLYGYVDHGDVYYRAPSAGTPAHTDAASAGFGVRFGWLNTGWLQNVSLDLSAAKAIAGPRDDWRGFFVVTARY